jgi:DNA-binding HxlR family transcriptional regulator
MTEPGRRRRPAAPDSARGLRPGSSARGSASGRPIMVLLDVLGQRWTLRVLWELRSERVNFRMLQARCDGLSPTVLNARLKMLRELCIVDHDADGYGLTRSGQELCKQLLALDAWAKRWADDLIDRDV